MTKDKAGIGTLMVRKEGTISGKSYYYYVNAGLVVVAGAKSNLGDYEILSGPYFGKTANKHNQYDEYIVTDYLSFSGICELLSSDKSFDLEKLMKKYQDNSGKYYTYDYAKREFNSINGEDIIRQIEDNERKLTLQKEQVKPVRHSTYGW